MRFYLREIEAHMETKREGPRIDAGVTVEGLDPVNGDSPAESPAMTKETTA